MRSASIGYAAAVDDGDSDGAARCAHPAAKLRVCLMNEHARDALAESSPHARVPAQTLEHVQALEVVLGRLRTNANARLLGEGVYGQVCALAASRPLITRALM